MWSQNVEPFFLSTISYCYFLFFFFSSRRRHTRFDCVWSSDVCSSDLGTEERTILIVETDRVEADACVDRHARRDAALHPRVPDAGHERTDAKAPHLHVAGYAR